MKTKGKALNITLWLAQGLLAIMFLMAACLKLFTPFEKLNAMMAWTTQFSALTVRLIGITEITASAGLLLPSILRIKPILTPWAATGLATIMVLAIGLHLALGEAQVIGINFFLLFLAIFVAWGRFKKVPIESKN